MNDDRSPADRLREARIHAGYRTATEAAAALGVKQGTYIAHETGQNGLKFEVAKTYARRFRVAPSWLLTGEGDGPGYSVANYSGDNVVRPDFGDTPPAFGPPSGTIPEIDVFAGMGGGGVAQEVVSVQNGHAISADAISDYWRIPGSFLSTMRARPEHMVVIHTKGDSNYPTINSTDAVILNIKHKHPSPDGLYALADIYGEVIVKRVTRISPATEEDPVFEIRSDNPNHPTRNERASELRIIGRVIGRVTAI